MSDSPHNVSGDVSLETEFPADGRSGPVQKAVVSPVGAFVEMELSSVNPNVSARSSPASTPSRQGSNRSLPRYYPKPRDTPPPRPPQTDFVPVSPAGTPQTPDRGPILAVPPAKPPFHHSPIAEMEEIGELHGVVYQPTTTAQPQPNSLLHSIPRRRDVTYDKMYSIYKESSGTGDYVRNLRVFVKDFGHPWAWFSIYCLVALGPFMMLVVGAMNVTSCTAEPMIPVYLMVAGSIWLLRLSMQIYETLLQSCSGTESSYGALSASLLWKGTETLLGIFLFVWLIAGAVWVYRVFRPSSVVDAEHPQYCHGYLYSVAFWSVTLQLAGVGILFIAATILMTCLALRQSRDEQRSLGDPYS